MTHFFFKAGEKLLKFGKKEDRFVFGRFELGLNNLTYVAIFSRDEALANWTMSVHDQRRLV